MTAITEYSQTEAALAELSSRYKGAVYAVTTGDGMGKAKKARAEIKRYRVALEAMRKEIKAPALERCQAIDSEAKRITATLTALEDPIDAQIKGEERKAKEAEEAKAKAEAEAIARAEAEKRAEEERKLQAQRDEIAKARAELEAAAEAQRKAAVEAERVRLAAEAESRKRIEETERASRERIEAEARTERLRVQAVEDVARQKRQEEENRLAAERRAVEDAAAKVRAEKEAAERKAQAERDEAERQVRLSAEKSRQGWEILRGFVSTYGALPEFADAATTVAELLRHHGKA
ncbi:MAG: DUF1351 domain-containing protein [Candidatus Thermoplasmatota archaeon]|jgi:hypothetical protein